MIYLGVLPYQLPVLFMSDAKSIYRFCHVGEHNNSYSNIL